MLGSRVPSHRQRTKVSENCRRNSGSTGNLCNDCPSASISVTGWRVLDEQPHLIVAVVQYNLVVAQQPKSNVPPRFVGRPIVGRKAFLAGFNVAESDGADTQRGNPKL